MLGNKWQLRKELLILMAVMSISIILFLQEAGVAQSVYERRGIRIPLQ
jgi:hypothetical protein